ncbi:MAG: hypothetical protein EP344_08515 [Bacteroidetes bacterium]|nr:MAG: hypothetical protein EP344_08515 [Bacteroidota bacterium]
MNKIKLAILKNEVVDDHLLWIDACQEYRDRLDYEIIDITRNDWLERIREGNYDGLLATPPGWTTPFKTLFDERMIILDSATDIPIYPSLEEMLIYENKKMLSYWLEAHRIPHPKTWVFYHEEEALDFVQNTPLPLVAKTSIGASGSGVSILRTHKLAAEYIHNTFSGVGTSRHVGPKWRQKGFLRRVLRKMSHPGELKAKLQLYQHLRTEVQKDFVIFQEYIEHDYEWRCVRIGDSFFGHKKIKAGDKASGSLIKGYEAPPFELLNFVREVTDLRHFLSQSVDIFVTTDGQYLINEMQCIFGQSDPYQMLIDGQPGRYRFLDGQWVFEPGDFNRHESFQLRVEHFIELLTNKNQEVPA